MREMKDYNSFAEHYDRVVGERRDVAALIRQILKTFAPNAKTLLELGCGSGSMLKVLSRYYAVTGLDRSVGMLKVARTKAPKACLVQGDITNFALQTHFDAIICPFDTINHVTSFSRWRAVFRRAHQHLQPDGIFVFDVNTEAKMERYRLEPAAADFEPDSVAIVDVKRLRRYQYQVMHKVFRRQKGNTFKLHEMELPELVVPTERIKRELHRYFHEVRLLDPDRPRVGKSSEEIFFICRWPR